MQVERQELRDILTALKPGLAKTKLVEQMSHFIFTGEDIVTFNDKVLVSYPFETDFECSIPADKLFNLISKMSSKYIDFSIKDNNLRIGGKTIKAGIRTLEKDELGDSIKSVKEQAQGDGWIPVPKDFVNGLYLTSFSASNDESTGTATCVYAKENKLYAGDRTRVSCYEMSGSVEEEFFVKASAAPFLADYYISMVKQSKSWIHFKTEDGLLFSLRKVVGQFPNYDPIFDNFKGDKLLFPSEEVKNALGVVTIIQEKEDTKAVEIKLTKGLMICSYVAENGREWVEKTLEIDYKGEDITFVVNSVFLSQVLEKATEVTISSDRSKLLFVSENFKHTFATMV